MQWMPGQYDGERAAASGVAHSQTNYSDVGADNELTCDRTDRDIVLWV